MFTPHNASHVIGQVSDVRYPVSAVRCQVYFFYKVLVLVIGGSVINGAYPIYFINVAILWKICSWSQGPFVCLLCNETQSQQPLEIQAHI